MTLTPPHPTVFAALAVVLVALLIPLPASADTVVPGNLIANSSFEGSLTGWRGWQSSLSLASGGYYGLYAAHVAAAKHVTSYTIDDNPNSVGSTTAGDVYSASAWVRGRTGKSVCIHIRESSSSRAVAGTTSCITVSGNVWKQVPLASYTARTSGDSIDVYVSQSQAANGDSFDVDGVVLLLRPPASTTAPTVSGQPVVGSSLSASTGSWSGTPTSFAYQWQRCTNSSCVDVSGATAATYTVGSADVGDTLRVAVTAANGGGSTTAFSGQTAVAITGVYSTSLTAGATLATPYTWTFDPGVVSCSGYFWADGTLLAKIVRTSCSTGPYTFVVQPGALSDGPHMLGSAWDTVDGQHHAGPTSYSVTVQNSVAAPVNTAAPTISGTASVGETLTATPGTWSGSPTSYLYQWQDCTSSGCAAISGATAPSYPVAVTDENDSLRVAVTAANSGGSTTATSSPSALVPTPASSPTSPTWATVTNFPQAPFTATRVIDIYTASAFWTAWNNLQPGDEIDVHGVTFSGEAVFKKQLSSWAEVHFDSATRFTGTAAGSDLPAVWIDKSADIRFYGGDISNVGGNGIRLDDSSSITWWSFTIHDTGGQGLFVTGTGATVSNLDFKGDISHWSEDLSLDPHAEKGTGIHAAQLADSNYGVQNSRFALDVHDGPYGSGISAGGSASTDFFRNNTIYVKCDNLTFQARIQVAANCFQYWGTGNTGNVIKYLEASNLQGRPYDANGLYSGQSLSTDTVEYGRATNTNLSPYLSQVESAIGANVHWDPRGSTVFGDVAPTP